VSRTAALVLVLAVVALDRATKLAVASSMHVGESVALVPGFLSLTYVRNRGAAFGLFAGASDAWRAGFLAAVALLAVFALVWLFASLPRTARWQRAAAAAVIGGALGNLYDRIVYGEVVDFVDVYVRQWHWPAFNVADSCITVGVIVLVAASFRGDRHLSSSR
jgi:signal peptidase II